MEIPRERDIQNPGLVESYESSWRRRERSFRRLALLHSAQFWRGVFEDATPGWCQQ